jgi:hypothetical protein
MSEREGVGVGGPVFRIDRATGVSFGRGLTVWAGGVACFSHTSTGKRFA